MGKPTQNSFTPNEGITEAEKYLYKLCRRTFLSLWSYPGLYKEPGKELCDLLVIFENNVIIFSDKYCTFPDSGNLQKDWSRWFKKAIDKSARQSWGAERWIKNNPNKIFSDRKATAPLPFTIPSSPDVKFHLMVVAHNGAKRCSRELGGSGSFMLRSDIVGFDKHTIPFTIGDLDASKTFIHVLDDTSLDILLCKLDTISDFVDYLTKKEQLLRSKLEIFATGEEELLAHYLKRTNDKGVHDFIFPEKSNGVALMEGGWEKFINDPQVKRQKEADKISYVWDHLIEQFSYHAFTGTQYFGTDPKLQSTEKILRLMAREPRLGRRMLSKTIIDLLEKTPKDKQATRYFGPRPGREGTTYVFFLFPLKEGLDEAGYRDRRIRLLEAYCQVAKLRFPRAKDIVGIATEPDTQNDLRSEDAIYFDASEWTEKRQKYAEELFEAMGLKGDTELNHYNENEYPDIVSRDPGILTVKLPKNPRNKLCPCGSGKKYKKCHGK
ncbi:MAG: SEC-C domain-containing protein [Candidatus Paceibacterota bacterium]|jgi:hypothetical protein